MTGALTHAVIWLNAVANFFGQALAFIAWMPGWLSATLIAIVSGIAMLLAFKYTSSQQAIKRARMQIRSSLLAVKLFFDSPMVGFRGQAAALLGALKLLVAALGTVPVMIIPVTLLLGQLALWYQARPLKIGEEAVITLKLDGDVGTSWPKVMLEPTDAIDDLTGPVRVFSEREICWNIRAQQAGYHTLVFRVDGQPIEKKLAIGDGFMRVSLRRPDWDSLNALEHPDESPFPPESPVRWIDVQYPTRSSWTSGADWWIVYWFIVSLIAAFSFKGVFKVNF